MRATLCQDGILIIHCYKTGQKKTIKYKLWKQHNNSGFIYFPLSVGDSFSMSFLTELKDRLYAVSIKMYNISNELTLIVFLNVCIRYGKVMNWTLNKNGDELLFDDPSQFRKADFSLLK